MGGSKSLQQGIVCVCMHVCVYLQKKERSKRGRSRHRCWIRRIRQTRQHQVRRTVRENRHGGCRERGESHEEHLVQRFREASAHGRASELCSCDRTRRFRRRHDCPDRCRDVHGMVFPGLIRFPPRKDLASAVSFTTYSTSFPPFVSFLSKKTQKKSRLPVDFCTEAGYSIVDFRDRIQCSG